MSNDGMSKEARMPNDERLHSVPTSSLGPHVREAPLRNMETFQKVDELMRVCRSAVRKAQAESKGITTETRRTRRARLRSVASVSPWWTWHTSAQLPGSSLVCRSPGTRRHDPFN